MTATRYLLSVEDTTGTYYVRALGWHGQPTEWTPYPDKAERHFAPEPAPLNAAQAAWVRWCRSPGETHPVASVRWVEAEAS